MKKTKKNEYSSIRYKKEISPKKITNIKRKEDNMTNSKPKILKM